MKRELSLFECQNAQKMLRIYRSFRLEKFHNGERREVLLYCTNDCGMVERTRDEKHKRERRGRWKKEDEDEKDKEGKGVRQEERERSKRREKKCDG